MVGGVGGGGRCRRSGGWALEFGYELVGGGGCVLGDEFGLGWTRCPQQGERAEDPDGNACRADRECEVITRKERPDELIVRCLERVGAVGGNRAEDGKAERPGNLLGDVDDPRAEPGVGGWGGGHRDGQERHERAADPKSNREGSHKKNPNKT